MNIHEFSDEEPPTTKLLATVEHPIDPGSSAGYLGDGNRGRVFWTPRKLGPDENGEQQFYRKIGGYAISEKVLAMCSLKGVQTVFVHETDTGTLYEFDTAQYTAAKCIDHIPEDPQFCVPLEERKYEWEPPEWDMPQPPSQNRMVAL